MSENKSIAHQYYKVQEYWKEALTHKEWKLAVWVAEYSDIEIISHFLDIEGSALGETEEVILKFNSVYTEDEEYEKHLWSEFTDWFNLENDPKYDMHKALIKDNYLKTPFVPNTKLSPTFSNLLLEIERFKKALIGIDPSLIIQFGLGMHQPGFGDWMHKRLKKDIPTAIRFVAIDIAKERHLKSFKRKTRSKVYEIHPQLNMLAAMKNEMKKEVKGSQPHSPDAKYKLTVLELMEALPKEKKMLPLIDRLFTEAKQLGEPSILVSSYLIVSHAYNTIKEPKKGLKHIEKAIVLTDTIKTSSQYYPLWRSSMLFKAAFLLSLSEEEDAFEVYEEIAQKASKNLDYFYIMEAYRICATIQMKKKKYEDAFEYALLALNGGCYLDLQTRQNSTFLYVANLAYNILEYILGENEKRPIVEEHLELWLGKDWKKLISAEENLNQHYAPLPKEQELISSTN